MLRASNFPCQHGLVRRRWKIVLFGLCGVIAVVAVCFFCLRDNEPSYNGRTLSEWLVIGSPPTEPGKRVEAQKAVLAMGTNAVPTLLEWCSERNLSRAQRDNQFLTKLPGIIAQNTSVLRWIRRDVIRLNYAVYGFQILGTNASVALPELARRFNTSTNESFVYCTAFLIGHLGKPGLDFLLSVLQKKTDPHRDSVLQVIGNAEDAEVAVPLMLSILNDANDPLAPQAAAELGKLGVAPERVVPQLINALRSTNISMRSGAIDGLRELGTNASAAIPALQMATNDSDAYVRSQALAALPIVAPDARTNGTSKRQ